MTKKLEIPADIQQLLSAADKKHGFPAGLMQSIMNQEGDGSFLADPGKYHYAKGADGRRIAPHTGQPSSAFGPFGILEDTTAKNPGYGVAPLKDKSLPEQVRFASDYLAARVKSAGSLEAGLAGYGEGPKYAQQVLARAGVSSGVSSGGGSSSGEPVAPGKNGGVAVASAPATALEEIPSAGVVLPDSVLALGRASAGKAPSDANAWVEFLNAMPKSRAPMQVADINYLMPTTATPPAYITPARVGLQAQGRRAPDFSAFQAWNPRRA